MQIDWLFLCVCIWHWQGFGRLSLVAASAAQSAANAVQAGTKELSSKVIWILILNVKKWYSYS